MEISRGVLAELELRKERPLAENVYDNFQKALEEEQNALNFASKVYLERMEISRGVLAELESAKVMLQQDMLKKRHAFKKTAPALQNGSELPSPQVSPEREDARQDREGSEISLPQVTDTKKKGGLKIA